MPDITLAIAPDLYTVANQIAIETARSVEDVLLDRLEIAFSTRPADEQAELLAFNHLSDEVLWVIAREQMPADQQARLTVLMDANTRGTLTDAMHQELTVLVEQGQKRTMRKAAAAAILTERGHTVTLDDPGD